MQTIRVLALLVFAATGAAQIIDTLPTGYGVRHGDYISGGGVSYPFSATTFRYQEVHNSWVGTTKPVLTAIGFRRGSFKVATATAVAHTLDAMVTMGFGSSATFTTTFANNYSATPTVVFTNKSVNMPSWTNPFTPPWTVPVWMNFDVPFAGAGSAPVIWELQTQNSTLPTPTSAGYNSDRTGTTSSAAVVQGTGCIATGLTLPATLTATWRNTGPVTGMGLTLGGANYPFNTAVLCNVGLTNPNIPFPGLCANIMASLDLTIAAGTSSATGALTSLAINFPFTPPLLQVALYTQGLAIDLGQPGIPVVLSDGRIGSMPPNNDAAGTVFKYTYVASTGAIGAGPFTAGSVITTFK